VPVVERYRDSFPPTRQGGTPLTIPQITPVLRSVIERPSFSFAAFSKSATDQTGELYGWTRKVFLAFGEIELRLLLEQIKPSLKFSA